MVNLFHHCLQCGELINTSEFHACSIENLTQHIKTGWICPQCETVWSPIVSKCNCNECTEVHY